MMRLQAMTMTMATTMRATGAAHAGAVPRGQAPAASGAVRHGARRITAIPMSPGLAGGDTAYLASAPPAYRDGGR